MSKGALEEIKYTFLPCIDTFIVKDGATKSTSSMAQLQELKFSFISSKRKVAIHQLKSNPAENWISRQKILNLFLQPDYRQLGFTTR